MIYIIYRDEKIFKVYKDRDVAYKRFDEFCDADVEQEYTWSTIGYKLELE